MCTFFLEITGYLEYNSMSLSQLREMDLSVCHTPTANLDSFEFVGNVPSQN